MVGVALAAANMMGILSGFLGGPAEVMDWLAAQPAPTAPAVERAVSDHAIRLATAGALRQLPGWVGEVGQAWQARADALAAYRTQLPAEVNRDVVVESLLHLHTTTEPSASTRTANARAVAWPDRPRSVGEPGVRRIRKELDDHHRDPGRGPA